MARIYFESGLGSLGLASGTVGTQVGTDFATSFPGPSLPPSGNNMPNTPWTGNLEAFGAQPSPASNGINVGEMLTISFDYFGTEGDLIAALTAANGNARIAAHILDCSDGESCVASVTPVPVPASLPLMLGALGVIGMLGRRRV